ncbi:serine/threonine-protein kinase [Cryptosporangium phraense]|uniref:non-specific serine/threonine protein kinase n=1 Tax=Cryptosporangium phraense TaxID=2593070 RepID=A0A545AH51_9ACTN|nr:serine/threonine-protein kinase [Cryptosporangium phraense]TQS40644.1 protein kinase [Cryptosporangium phraense]
MSGSCIRPGCTGSYDPDGYCDDCGRKAPASPPSPTNDDGPSSSGTSSIETGDRSTRGTGPGRLGGGMVDLPRVPPPDPAGAVLADPQVPENSRHCGKCGAEVGRSRNGKPGRVEGFCPKCRTPFSFVPSLTPGTLVSGRYEVLGCLAYGGLGWIYLARDKNVGDDVSDRWVVLKGLINSGDPDAMEAAVSERRYLVTVDHPSIVKIHDFAKRRDRKLGADVGYIVMEYVGGRSLRDLRVDPPRPLPLAQVLAYGLAVLPAFGYLHDRGLLYCDFKPDNVIHTDDRLTIVDLGAVRRIDDHVSAGWETPGYSAPEVGTAGASVTSDLYTVARTMAVLSLEFAEFSTTYRYRLPSPAQHPVLADNESYHRLLLRATHTDVARRFESAADLADQLVGVLRQVLSAADGTPRPAASTRFAGEGAAFAPSTGRGVLDGPSIAAALPVPQVDPADPGTTFLLATRERGAAELTEAVRSAPADSVEVPIALARAHLREGDPAAARAVLDALAAVAPLDWRIPWYRGLAALIDERPGEALAAFDDVYGALPGELAPQLAMAVAAEWAGETEAALGRYQRVWNCDHAYVGAAFGLARLLLAGRNPGGAIGVLESVPSSSAQHSAAQVAALRARLAGPGSAQMFRDVSDRVQGLPLDDGPRARLSVEILDAALGWVSGNGAGHGTEHVLGHPLTERGLRLGLEQVYRALAKAAPTVDERITLVDRANAVRPRTLV